MCTVYTKVTDDDAISQNIHACRIHKEWLLCDYHKTQAASIVAIVNVHIVHHSEFSNNRLITPFPRISNHAVYSQRVCNVITTNKR